MRKPFFILAPMDDVTDTVFRRIVADCSPPDFTMTEFVNVDGLMSPGRKRLIRKLDTTLDTAPAIAQIWGKNPDNFEAIAKEISDGEIPGFVGIDLNFGCPAKSEVRAGCCSALQKLELRPDAAAMIEATLRGAAAGQNNLPVSFKTRLGFSEIDYTWHEFLLGYKPSMLTVHVRTTKQMSKVPAQWEAIAPIIELRDELSPETKIVMNGDIMNHQHGLEIAEQYGVDGTMIGRGIFQDPYAFAIESPWGDMSKSDKIALFKKHVTMHDSMYLDGERPFNPLKKFAKVYISGFDGAAELRARVMDTTNVQDALSVIAS